MNKHDDIKNSRKIPLTRWHEFHVWPSVGGLRHLVNQSEKNGFDKVIRRCGRRILIDEQSFFEWIDKQPRGSRRKENKEK